MARNSLDSDLEDLPQYMISAFGVSRDWMRQGKCWKPTKRDPRNPWTMSAADAIVIGDTTYYGPELIELALMSCVSCPVQWACTRFALETWPNWGTWGLGISDLRWLHKHPGLADAILDESEEAGTPVQVATARARDEERAHRSSAPA